MSVAQEDNDENRQGVSETGDEILGTSISNEQKMQHIRTLDAIFGKGAPHQDLNLLRLLHVGVLNTVMLSPRRSEFDLGNTCHEVCINVNGKQLTITADGKVEIAAVIVGDNRDFQPGKMVPGKGIFIGTFDLVDANGSRLGIRTNWYDAAIELGEPKTFNDTAKAVADHSEKGRGGLHLDPARYEAELFEKLKTGEAMDKNVIAPLEVVKAIHNLRNQGEYRHLSDGNLPGQMITTARSAGSAHWQWSCTPYSGDPHVVRAVTYPDGDGVWSDRNDYRLSGRACFAELAL